MDATLDSRRNRLYKKLSRAVEVATSFRAHEFPESLKLAETEARDLRRCIRTDPQMSFSEKSRKTILAEIYRVDSPLGSALLRLDKQRYFHSREGRGLWFALNIDDVTRWHWEEDKRKIMEIVRQEAVDGNVLAQQHLKKHNVSLTEPHVPRDILKEFFGASYNKDAVGALVSRVARAFHIPWPESKLS